MSLITESVCLDACGCTERRVLIKTKLTIWGRGQPSALLAEVPCGQVQEGPFGFILGIN